jgi:hypothetical protein
MTSRLFFAGGFGSNVNSGNPGTTNFSYTFHGDPRATFAEFFGTNNPFESFFSANPGDQGSILQNSISDKFSYPKFPPKSNKYVII